MNKFFLYFAIGIPLFVIILFLRYFELINNLLFLILTCIFMFYLHFLRKRLKIDFFNKNVN